MDESQRQRLKLQNKLLGPAAAAAAGASNQRFKENRPTYQEKFVPPATSMISYFMTKVSQGYRILLLILFASQLLIKIEYSITYTTQYLSPRIGGETSL